VADPQGVLSEANHPMENYTLLVPSIGCQGCVNKIVKQLQALSGVEVVKTDVSTKTLALRYRPEEISPEQIDDAVRAIGHQVASKESDLAEESV
jgi:copper chaperone CopZ